MFFLTTTLLGFGYIPCEPVPFPAVPCRDPHWGRGSLLLLLRAHRQLHTALPSAGPSRHWGVGTSWVQGQQAWRRAQNPAAAQSVWAQICQSEQQQKPSCKDAANESRWPSFSIFWCGFFPRASKTPAASQSPADNSLVCAHDTSSHRHFSVPINSLWTNNCHDKPKGSFRTCKSGWKKWKIFYSFAKFYTEWERHNLILKLNPFPSHFPKENKSQLV